MSRLDYITIAIVAICILAIIFLVYKMTDLFGGKTEDKIENAEGRVETEADDTYDMEADDTTDLSGTAVTDTEGAPTTSTSGGTTTAPTTKPATTMTAEDAESEDDVADAEDEISTSSAPTISNSGGRYLVIAGTFTKKSLGNNQVAKLKKMGYDNASLEVFDRGKYAVVLVDRYEDMASAEKLIAKLKKDGVKSYVKVKEKG